MNELQTGLLRNFEIVPVGDTAALLRFSEKKNVRLNSAIHHLAEKIRVENTEGLKDIIPGYSSLLLRFISKAHLDSLCKNIGEMLSEIKSTELLPERLIEVPVFYGGEYGPDIQKVADNAGIAGGEAARIHSQNTYYVYCVGFSPGFPYLGGLTRVLHCPRKAEPRQNIPGGSVGIGGEQTGVYPQPGPGGWQIIGQTPSKLFDIDREPPSVLRPGDLLRFRQISIKEFQHLSQNESCPDDYAITVVDLDREQSELLIAQVEDTEYS